MLACLRGSLIQTLCPGHKCGATPGSCCCPRSGQKHLIVPTLAHLKKKKSELSSGFGGAVRKGKWQNLVVASKKFHRGDDELLSELYFGLLTGASPSLGFCTTPDGQPRLLSSFLPKTCFQYVQGMASMGDWPMHARWKFVHDFVLAISRAAQGLVHCDLKPDNVMVGPGRPDFSVYLVDFGCVARPGDSVPMTCLSYKPPEDTVSLSWDVFSAGRILQELEGGVGVVQVLSRAVLGTVFALAL